MKYGTANDITICVDSKQRWTIDTIYGSSALADYMDVVWGGLWGHVTLEARPENRIASIYLRGDIHKR
ncbi:MAG: hypothetical protein PHQ75_15030 [Thermoguttaceae bacterium]|nr:hypothetical protein [Thermoguttaceae bacterium]